VCGEEYKIDEEREECTNSVQQFCPKPEKKEDLNSDFLTLFLLESCGVFSGIMRIYRFPDLPSPKQ